MSDKELIAALIMVIASLLTEKPGARSNQEYADLIDLWIHSERGRAVLKRSLIDGMTVEQIAEEIDRSPRQTARILKRGKEVLSTKMS